MNVNGMTNPGSFGAKPNFARAARLTSRLPRCYAFTYKLL
jgi:hypothetical protein